MVGYFTNWAQYRPGAGTFHPSHLDASLLTNLVYAFAAVSSTFTIQTIEV
jgi:chitinase